MTFIIGSYSTVPTQTFAGLLRSLCFQILETFFHRPQLASLPNLRQHGNQNDGDITSAGEGKAGEEISRKCQPVLFQPCGLLSFISALNNLTFMLNQFTLLLAVT